MIRCGHYLLFNTSVKYLLYNVACAESNTVAVIIVDRNIRLSFFLTTSDIKRATENERHRIPIDPLSYDAGADRRGAACELECAG